MIFSFSADGTPNGLVPERIFQGSKRANDIIFICPTSATNIVTAKITFPDGSVSDSYVMENVTPSSLTGIVDDLGNRVNIFRLVVPTAVTALCGIMSVQFFVTNGNGERLATAISQFTVEEGNVDFDPEEIDSYEDILEAISVIYGSFSTVNTAIAGKVSKLSSANKIYSTNGSGNDASLNFGAAAVGGTVVCRDTNGRASVASPVAAGEIANKEYVDGKASAISNDIDGVESSVSAVETAVNSLTGRVTSAENILKGKNKSVAFSNYSQFISDTLTRDGEYYNVGQNVYIVAMDVPDLWISEVLSTKSSYTFTGNADIISALSTTGYICVGYYKISALETEKVDLTPFMLKTSVYTTENQDGSITLNIVNA